MSKILTVKKIYISFRETAFRRVYILTAYLPLYSGKQTVSGLCLIFSAKRSFLLRNKMMEVSTNHLLLQIESNSFMLSIMRFISSSSARTRSYPDRATQKMMAVTPSKQWIHFLRSDRWPPTSNILQKKRTNRNIATAEITKLLFLETTTSLAHFKSGYQLKNILIISAALTFSLAHEMGKFSRLSFDLSATEA